MNIEHKIDDRIAKLICVPLIGILFPNITGLIINSRYSLTLLLLQYGYFIFLLYVFMERQYSRDTTDKKQDEPG